jgi:hypothetical protein
VNFFRFVFATWQETKAEQRPGNHTMTHQGKPEDPAFPTIQSKHFSFSTPNFIHPMYWTH